MLPISPNRQHQAKRRYVDVPASPRVKRQRQSYAQQRRSAFVEPELPRPKSSTRSSVHELTSILQGQQMQNNDPTSRSLVYRARTVNVRSPFAALLQQNAELYQQQQQQQCHQRGNVAVGTSSISNMFERGSHCNKFILNPPPSALLQRIEGSDRVRAFATPPPLVIGRVDDIVRLNVSGTVFRTRRGTFTSICGSHLANMFAGAQMTNAVDRDAEHFAIILKWLRDRRTCSTWPMSDKNFVDDVKFYGLSLEMFGEGAIVVLGGEDDDGAFDTAERFCPISQQWTELPALPTKRDAHACATLNGHLYVCGGYDEQGKKCATLYRLEASRKSWTTLPPMRSPRCRHQLVATNGSLYALGGLAQVGGAHPSCFMEEFKPTTMSWKVTPSPSQLRYGFGSVVLDGNIYVIGGLRPNGQRTTMVECYNISSGQWQCVEPMPTPRAYLCCVVDDGKIYAIGGNNDQNQPSRTVELYDPRTNSWSNGPDTAFNRCDAGCVALNGMLYLFGGEDDEDYLCNVEVFDPTLQVWKPGVEMDLPKSSFASCVVPY